MGRGSAVGSLICYLIGITSVEPTRYGLLFERFLNPERVSMPDIDTDFSPDIRDYAIKYVKHIYGEDAVCQIMTQSTYGAKASIRAAARIYGDRVYGDKVRLAGLAGDICSYVSPEPNAKIDANDLKTKFANNPDAIQIIDDALLLEGAWTAVGVHPAGVIIADNGEDESH